MSGQDFANTGWTDGVRHTYHRRHIENTRLVLNRAQVYPARLRKSKIMSLAEQDKLELSSTLILVFYTVVPL